MFIPVLNASGEQIAWIDHLKLEKGSLFLAGDQVFRLADGSTLVEVTVGEIDPADFIDVAANGE